MKIKIISAFLALCMCFGLSSCESNRGNKDLGHFVVVDTGNDINFGTVITVYAKDTKVMYAMYYKGSITPLYNADGTLQIYEEE